jgi:hypothetical protein
VARCKSCDGGNLNCADAPDYFFEPVAGLTYRDLRSSIVSRSDLISAGGVVQLSADFLWYLPAYDSDGIYNYSYGYHRSIPTEWRDARHAKQWITRSNEATETHGVSLQVAAATRFARDMDREGQDFTMQYHADKAPNWALGVGSGW